MALIRCPECNNEISDKAASCPNCGYPMDDNITMGINAVIDADLQTLIKQYGKDKVGATKKYRDITGVSLTEAHRIVSHAYGESDNKGNISINAKNKYSNEIVVKCSKCNAYYPASDAKCPSCGERQNNIPLLPLLIIICLLVGIVGFVVKLTDSGSSGDRSVDAWICAKNAVEEQLKSPSTAKFPSYSKDYITNLGNDKYRISAYVDAQNSFGATTRQNFTVRLTLTKSGYKDESVTFK